MKQLFALALALWGFSSCSQDSSDMNGSTTGGETVSIRLSAEVSVDAEEARALSHKLGTNAGGEVVPMPEFTDGQEVEVHTILKSSTGINAAKTLKWKYVAAKKKLVLSPADGHDIPVSGFNNDNGVKWYISGLIGGDLAGTRVEFMGTRVVKGVDGNAGDALGSMSVPYAFGWTELTINTSSPKDGNNSHKYAAVPASTDVKFKPMGSMLAVKLGTAQSAGAYTFTPTGFRIYSSAWLDQGTFELNTDIPSTNPHTSLPKWREGWCIRSMYFTFASGEEPGTIAHNQTTDKTYYIWVMPNQYQPTRGAVSVLLEGTSSRPETATYRDYTNTWFTDYKTKAGTQGKVTQGKVHPLTAKASHRVALPIEYVTEYNLAGGPTIASTTNPQPAGLTGSLRFANSHSNDQSGYYNWYKVKGRHDATYNPDTRNLQAEVDATFGADKYDIPTIDQWSAAVPPRSHLIWTGAERLNEADYVRFGSGPDELRRTYLSDYSKAFSTNNATSDATIYAIRFKARPSAGSICPFVPVENSPTSGLLVNGYELTTDDKMKCAYRFRRVGGRQDWETSWGTTTNNTNRLAVDVVYLGEESTPTELATISNDAWWSAKASENKVISRVFPAGYWLSIYWSLNMSNPSTPSAFSMNMRAERAEALGSEPIRGGGYIRLFARRPL